MPFIAIWLYLLCSALMAMESDTVLLKTNSDEGTITVVVTFAASDIIVAHWKDRPKLITEGFKRAEKVVKNALEVKLKEMKDAAKKPPVIESTTPPKTRAEVVPLELEFR